MKSYEVEYIKGHLIDVKTGKRIFLKPGGSFNILADNHQFEEKDKLNELEKPLSSEEKLAELKNDFKDFHFEKVADAGMEFIYRIGLSKMASEDSVPEFLFNAKIKEDLYIKSKKRENWNLCSCLCITTECLEGDVQMFESIAGKSLSNLFGNVITFYFAFQRSTACNAFRTFFFKNDASKPILSDVKNRYIRSLDEFRNITIKKYSKK